MKWGVCTEWGNLLMRAILIAESSSTAHQSSYRISRCSSKVFYSHLSLCHLQHMLPLALLVLPLKGLGHVNRAVLARTVSNLAGESKSLSSLTSDLGFTATGACPNDPADVL